MSLDKTGQISSMILSSIVKMVKGLIGLENLSGPITIAKVAGQSAEMGLQTFISFMALMSVSLGILNLLPIPMLDGGHLAYYIIEAIRGKPVSEQIQMFGLKIGMVLLGSMMPDFFDVHLSNVGPKPIEYTKTLTPSFRATQ